MGVGTMEFKFTFQIRAERAWIMQVDCTALVVRDGDGWRIDDVFLDAVLDGKEVLVALAHSHLLFKPISDYLDNRRKVIDWQWQQHCAESRAGAR